MNENLVKKENEVASNNNNSSKNVIIAILVFIIIILIGVGIYFAFIKKDNSSDTPKPQDSTQENDEKTIAKLNDGLRELLFEQLTPEEFKEKAKQYCTDDLITKLLKYYNTDTSSVCLSSGGCNVKGGYIGDTTDIYYRDFRIVSKSDTIIEGVGKYGESKNDFEEQKIRYKLVSGTWKIDDFDIIDNNSNNQSNDTETITISNNEIKKIELGEASTTIKINNKNINLKVIDSTLYVNNVKQEDVMLEHIVFATSKYILVAGVGQNGYGIDYAVDENGKVIDVYKSVVADAPYAAYQVNNIRMENGKVVADYYHDSCTMMSVDTKNCESKVEFVYDGNNIIMKDISLTNGTQALTRIILSNSNKLIKFNNKYVKLRTEPDKIYFNDKLIKDFGYGYNEFGVYVSEKMIFIYWVGSQCNPVFIGAINENGGFVDVKNPNGDYVYGLYVKDGVVMGTGNVCQTEPDESKKYNAKFVYDGKSVTLVKEK